MGSRRLKWMTRLRFSTARTRGLGYDQAVTERRLHGASSHDLDELSRSVTVHVPSYQAS
jgi:hypothetical protein